MSNPEIIAKNLKLLRKISRITQQELSSKLELNYRHYQSIEAGKVDLKLSTLERLADFFGVPLQCFFGSALSVDTLCLESINFSNFFVQVLSAEDYACLKACRSSHEITGKESLVGAKPLDFAYPVQEGRKRAEASFAQVAKKTMEKGECHFPWKICANEHGNFCSPDHAVGISHLDVSMVAVDSSGKTLFVAFSPKNFTSSEVPQI